MEPEYEYRLSITPAIDRDVVFVMLVRYDLLNKLSWVMTTRGWIQFQPYERLDDMEGALVFPAMNFAVRNA